MVGHEKTSAASNFRKFFLRGLGILLPTVLTIWILIAAYGFVRENIATPINDGVKYLVVCLNLWPWVSEQDVQLHKAFVRENGPPGRYASLQNADRSASRWRMVTRRAILDDWWLKYRFPLDLIGLFIAAILIYCVGAILGSYIGRRLHRRGEELISRVPLIRQVYPHVKQVTDFLFGSDSARRIKFNKVVAVEYPRKGLWSVGLVTGNTMRRIEERMAGPCLTVFVPSSPTPFTGYVITVPKEDTIELPITIEQALRFTVSGGVIIPPNQVIAEETGSSDRVEVASALEVSADVAPTK